MSDVVRSVEAVLRVRNSSRRARHPRAPFHARVTPSIQELLANANVEMASIEDA